MITILAAQYSIRLVEIQAICQVFSRLSAWSGGAPTSAKRNQIQYGNADHNDRYPNRQRAVTALADEWHAISLLGYDSAIYRSGAINDESTQMDAKPVRLSKGLYEHIAFFKANKEKIIWTVIILTRWQLRRLRN